MPSVLHDLTLIEALIIVGLGASTFLYLLGLYSAHEFFSRRKAAPAGGNLPPVTVLKPLKGVDVELHENLVSLCRQRYDRFQILLGVADPADPAVLLARRLQQEYPDVDIELVVDSRVYGTNYKVSNLHNMMQRAKHEVIVLADSDIRVGPDYLRRVVAPLSDPRVGLTTCLYRAVNRGGLPTLVESLFIHTDFDALVMVARKVEKSTYAFGATIALRRQVLDEIGGFLPLANYLADDYQLGNRVAARGYELALSDEIVDTVIAAGQLAAPVRSPASLGANLPDLTPRWILRQHPHARNVLGAAERPLPSLQPAQLPDQPGRAQRSLLLGRRHVLALPARQHEPPRHAPGRPEGPVRVDGLVPRLRREHGRLEWPPLSRLAQRRDGRHVFHSAAGRRAVARACSDLRVAATGRRAESLNGLSREGSERSGRPAR